MSASHVSESVWESAIKYWSESLPVYDSINLLVNLYLRTSTFLMHFFLLIAQIEYNHSAPIGTSNIGLVLQCFIITSFTNALKTAQDCYIGASALVR